MSQKAPSESSPEEDQSDDEEENNVRHNGRPIRTRRAPQKFAYLGLGQPLFFMALMFIIFGFASAAFEYVNPLV